MAGRSLYRVLVPDAPQHRRTEVDEVRRPEIGTRSAALRQVVPGLQAPSLVSSFEGSIDRIMFCFPSWAVADPRLVAAYSSVINALRTGTRFVVVHNASVGSLVEGWFAAAGHPAENVELVPVPDYVTLTDWAEDAYVALADGADGSRYLMEPWTFGRVGDALIADAVEEHTDIKASASPLVFQGGNCLVGDAFWLLGRDYLADTVALLTDHSSPVEVPAGQDPGAFATYLFSQYVEAGRRLIPVGTKKPLPLQDYVGTREGAAYFLDLPTGGAGTFQPIFHIDMFVTLVGLDDGGRFRALVGSPAMADELLGTSSPFALPEVYERLARDLEQEGLVVTRNPLVHRPTVGQTLTLRRLKELAQGPDGDALGPAVDQLAAAGAGDATPVRVRDWHHITWNNCLVENSAAAGRFVYLPTFGHGPNADLASVDGHMKALWEDLGFTVRMLADFNRFAERQGVVHCIKKYLARGD